MAILLQRKNIGANVIYYLLGATERSHGTFQKNVPEGFKSRFDTAIAKYSSRAAGIFRNFGFTKQKHIRGEKSLKL